MLIAFGILFIIFIAFFCIFQAIGCIVNYLSLKYEYKSHLPSNDCAIVITFEEFFQWYNLNKERWLLCDNCVKIRTNKQKISGWDPFNNYYRTCFFESFKDWKKYKAFQKELEKTENKEKTNKIMVEILEAIQQDIDALRKQSNQEIKEASDKASEIAKKLKG